MRQIRRTLTPVAGICICACTAFCAETAAGGLPLHKTLTQYGITWTLHKEVAAGQFVNGDWYVVGPVTVVKIDPNPTDARNGSMLNIDPTRDRAGFDDRLNLNRWDAALFRAPPIELKPGDSLVSSVSYEQPRTVGRMMRSSSKSSCPVRTAAVLTCVDAPVPADAFRPAYCDKENTIYLARNLRRSLLPSVRRSQASEGKRRGLAVLHTVEPDSWDVTDLSIWVRVFQRPWLDTCFDGLSSPVENMPEYGREIARAAGIGALLLCCDYAGDEKESLLINMVQVGIDLWGAIEAGGHGWPAHGGHGQGRKFMVVFAGYMLNSADMMNPYAKYPDVKFSEDQQTLYGNCWTGARVVWGGHVGPQGLKGKVGWGLYENTPPVAWEDRIGESYRRCCSSLCWVGEAMALRLLKMEEIWNHQAFFDYVDRWMNEDDAEHIRIINEAKGWDFSAEWSRQRQCWDPFVEDMYRTYRPQFGPQQWQGSE